MTAPRTYFSDAAVCIAFWNNVVLIDVGGEMDLARMRMIAEAYRELAASYPRIVALCVMRLGTPVAGSEARAEGARFTKEMGDTLAMVAMVIEAKGIGAQMLRSVIRGINVIARNTNMAIESSIDAAIRSVSPLVVTTSPRLQVPSELKVALLQVRASFQPEQPRVSGIGQL